MKKTAAYLRVSTGNQIGSGKYGLAAQKETIEQYARSENLQIIKWYSDEGISGSTLDRPGLLEMLRDGNNNLFTFVLVAKMDRVARDVYYQLYIEKEFLKSNIEIISASEPFRGNDPMMNAFRQIIAVFAELEKSIITTRLKNGRRQKALTSIPCVSIRTSDHNTEKAFYHYTLDNLSVLNIYYFIYFYLFFCLFKKSKHLF